MNQIATQHLGTDPGRRVERLCLLGGESSGKTTLARALSQRLGTISTTEYGRTLYEQRNGRLVYEDMLHIGQVQAAHEDELEKAAARYLICDTSCLTTLLYSELTYGSADPALRRLAEQRYDFVFLCAPDFPFVQDGWRADAAFRQQQHDWYVAELERRAMAYVIVTGSVEQRVASVLEVLGERVRASAPLQAG